MVVYVLVMRRARLSRSGICRQVGLSNGMRHHARSQHKSSSLVTSSPQRSSLDDGQLAASPSKPNPRDCWQGDTLDSQRHTGRGLTGIPPVGRRRVTDGGVSMEGGPAAGMGAAFSFSGKQQHAERWCCRRATGIGKQQRQRVEKIFRGLDTKESIPRSTRGRRFAELVTPLLSSSFVLPSPAPTFVFAMPRSSGNWGNWGNWDRTAPYATKRPRCTYANHHQPARWESGRV